MRHLLQEPVHLISDQTLVRVLFFQVYFLQQSQFYQKALLVPHEFLQTLFSVILANLKPSCVYISPREITATSVVPPPISTTILATGSPTGKPTPIAAAFGSEIRYTSLAPARSAELTTARLSTAVMPDGIAINILGRTPHLRL